MAKKLVTGADCEVSQDFEYNGLVKLGNQVKIGSNVKVFCDSIEIEDNCVIKEGVHIQGGIYHIGKNTLIRPYARLHVTKKFSIGPNSKIGCYWNISGRDISIGEHLWCVDVDFLGHGIIGGGSCFDVHSKLVIGNHCHLGMETYINTARTVTIGDNVGFGFRSMIFTHGAWQNVLEGYPVNFSPVTIEDNAWIPTNIIIMPGVRIGTGATIGSGSVVNKDIPPSSLAGGVPARIIRDNTQWPKKLTLDEKYNLLRDIINTWKPFIMDLGFEIIEAIENKKYVQIRLEKEQQAYNLICFKEKEDKPPIDVNVKLTVLTFDEEYYSDSADCIYYLTSYSILKKKENIISDHIANFLRRRGVKFFKEKSVSK